eukprot:gene12241-14454_t
MFLAVYMVANFPLRPPEKIAPKLKNVTGIVNIIRGIPRDTPEQQQVLWNALRSELVVNTTSRDQVKFQEANVKQPPSALAEAMEKAKATPRGKATPREKVTPRASRTSQARILTDDASKKSPPAGEQPTEVRDPVDMPAPPPSEPADGEAAAAGNTTSADSPVAAKKAKKGKGTKPAVSAACMAASPCDTATDHFEAALDAPLALEKGKKGKQKGKKVQRQSDVTTPQPQADTIKSQPADHAKAKETAGTGMNGSVDVRATPASSQPSSLKPELSQESLADPSRHVLSEEPDWWNFHPTERRRLDSNGSGQPPDAERVRSSIVFLPAMIDPRGRCNFGGWMAAPGMQAEPFPHPPASTGHPASTPSSQPASSVPQLTAIREKSKTKPAMKDPRMVDALREGSTVDLRRWTSNLSRLTVRLGHAPDTDKPESGFIIEDTLREAIEVLRDLSYDECKRSCQGAGVLYQWVMARCKWLRLELMRRAETAGRTLDIPDIGVAPGKEANVKQPPSALAEAMEKAKATPRGKATPREKVTPRASRTSQARILTDDASKKSPPAGEQPTEVRDPVDMPAPPPSEPADGEAAAAGNTTSADSPVAAKKAKKGKGTKPAVSAACMAASPCDTATDHFEAALDAPLALEKGKKGKQKGKKEVKILLENKYAAYYIKTSDYSKEGLKTRENGQRSSINDSRPNPDMSCAAAEMRQVCKAMEKEQVAQLAAQLELKVREWKAGLGAAEQSVHDHRNLEENVMLYVHYRSSQRTAGPSTDGGELMLLNISRSPVAGSQAILRICDKLVADQARLDAISPIREDAEEALMQQLEALKGSKVRLKEARQQVTTADHQAQNADMEYSRAEDQLKAARTKDAFIAALEPSSSGGKLDACEESAGGNRLTRQQVAAGAAIATARSRESEAMRQVADATASLREAQSLLQVEEAGCRAAEDTYSKTLRHVEGVREDDTMLVASMRASFNSLTETRKALRTASQDAAKKCQEAEVELAKAEARHAQTQKHLQMIKSPQRSPR